MDTRSMVDSTQEVADSVGPYTVYSAGELFTQHDLATNVLIKEAIGRLSSGKFQLFLPQSRELRDLDRPDIAAYIRNSNLLEIVKADIILARFDGVELDSGTVIEYAMAKHLGKPTVILRCDFRRLSCKELSEPYNLMLKNWPRNAVVHINSFANFASIFSQERRALGDSDAFQATMQAELGTVQKSVDEIARQIMEGLQAVLKLESPYPAEYQEMVYKASRYGPGSSFDQLLTESELSEIIRRLRGNGTL